MGRIHHVFRSLLMKRALVLGISLLASVGVAGCGEDPTSPTSLQSPFQGQFGGTWSGATVPTRVSSGECVGDDLRAGIASNPIDQGTITVTQTDNNVSAIVRSASTGLTCRYEGTASLSSFAATSVSCDAEILFRCSNGNPRILRPVGSTMTAFQAGATATGVVTSSYNIFFLDPAANKEIPVSGLTIESRFTASRR
jgi:hypothetical protein